MAVKLKKLAQLKLTSEAAAGELNVGVNNNKHNCLLCPTFPSTSSSLDLFVLALSDTGSGRKK